MYTGRFAPSPTGPLHFGSLIAALGSYLQARHAGGRWLLRMEDIDPPREVPGAADEILRTLEAFGFEWDGPVRYQSRRSEAYRAALAELLAGDAAYACTCSRSTVADAIAAAGGRPGVYPGTCRARRHAPAADVALRLDASGPPIRFADALQGEGSQDVQREVGDFVVRRADGLFAYQLAVVVDDADQGVTEVVRGCDLLDNTPRQILLQRRLGLETPAYVHLPLAVNRSGQKLSKQTHAPALDRRRPQAALLAGLRFLGQALPAGLEGATPAELLTWATAHWRLAAVPPGPALQPPPPPADNRDERYEPGNRR
jgi:glutamyl-Q tRNA(Asp) synthetase